MKKKTKVFRHRNLELYSQLRQRIINAALIGEELTVCHDEHGYIAMIKADGRYVFRRDTTYYYISRVEPDKCMEMVRDYFEKKRRVQRFHLDYIDMHGVIGQFDQIPPGPLFNRINTDDVG